MGLKEPKYNPIFMCSNLLFLKGYSEIVGAGNATFIK